MSMPDPPPLLWVSTLRSTRPARVEFAPGLARGPRPYRIAVLFYGALAAIALIAALKLLA